LFKLVVYNISYNIMTQIMAVFNLQEYVKPLEKRILMERTFETSYYQIQGINLKTAVDVAVSGLNVSE
jgi:hypothetical protein